MSSFEDFVKEISELAIDRTRRVLSSYKNINIIPEAITPPGTIGIALGGKSWIEKVASVEGSQIIIRIPSLFLAELLPFSVLGPVPSERPSKFRRCLREGNPYISIGPGDSLVRIHLKEEGPCYLIISPRTFNEEFFTIIDLSHKPPLIIKGVMNRIPKYTFHEGPFLSEFDYYTIKISLVIMLKSDFLMADLLRIFSAIGDTSIEERPGKIPSEGFQWISVTRIISSLADELLGFFPSLLGVPLRSDFYPEISWSICSDRIFIEYPLEELGESRPLLGSYPTTQAVGPTIFLTLAIAFAPSSTRAITGPIVMEF